MDIIIMDTISHVKGIYHHLLRVSHVEHDGKVTAFLEMPYARMLSPGSSLG